MRLIQHRSSHSYLSPHVLTRDPQGALTLRAIPSNGRVLERPRARARFIHVQTSKHIVEPTSVLYTPTSERHLRAIRFLAARLSVDRLEPFCGTMHNAGGGEALRVMLEKRASACVTIVSAIATREHVTN